jgi:hypothetical protein
MAQRQLSTSEFSVLDVVLLVAATYLWLDTIVLLLYYKLLLLISITVVL